MNKKLLQQALDALPLATFPFKHEAMFYKSDVLAAIAQPVQPVVDLVQQALDAQRYRRIRNGPHSDRHGDLYAMTFQGDGDVPVNGQDLDQIVDASIASKEAVK